MTADDVEAVAATISMALQRNVPEASARERLYPRLIRHLPVLGASEGSAFCPPVWCLRVGLSLGLPATQATALTAAGAFFFSAADLADDVADAPAGATPPGPDVDDVCRLLFVHQRLLLALPGVEPARATRLADVFVSAGLEMVEGQDLDLAGTDAVRAAPPLRIAEKKSGAECAAFFAAPALLAGVDPEPWARYGRALGALVQVVTDFLDLTLDPESDDWKTGKPSLPLRLAVEDPRHGAAVRSLAAGARTAPGRLRSAVWLLCQSGGVDRLLAAVAAYDETMAKARSDAGGAEVLARLRDEVAPWIDGLQDALLEFGREGAPALPVLSVDGGHCRRVARAWLAADPRLEREVFVDRRGLSGDGPVEGGVFERLWVAELLAAAEEPVPRGLVGEAFERADRDGVRYFPGRGRPIDADTAALALAVAAGTRAARLPGLRGVADRLAAAVRPDGSTAVWLSGEDGDPARCAGAAALTLLALARARHPDTRRVAEAIAGAWTGPETPSSPAFVPAAVDALGVWGLAAASALDPGLRGLHESSVTAVAERWPGRLSGMHGSVLSTALLAWALGPRLGEPGPIARALVDAQEADGGYPAEPVHRRRPVDAAWWRSRALTCAAALAALRRFGI